MKKLILTLLILWTGSGLLLADSSAWDLQGSIRGENILFDLGLDMQIQHSDSDITLLEGSVALLDHDLPRRVELQRFNNRVVGRFDRKGSYKLNLKFAGMASVDGEWRQTRVRLPHADVRKITLVTDRPDLKVEFPGAVRVERGEGAARLSRSVCHAGVETPERFTHQRLSSVGH